MSNFKNYREESRKNWGSDQPAQLGLDQINTGALLRIADATEAMAIEYNRLIRENNDLKTRNDYLRKDNQRMAHRIRGLKAAYTRLKNKLPVERRITEEDVE